MTWRNRISYRVFILILVAVAAIGLMAVYRTHTSAVNASWLGAVATSNVAPLNENEVQPLVDSNRAMEAVAARVTPAVVNINVTAKIEPSQNDQQMQQFFGQFFGRQFQPQPPRPQIERGEGSGVIISPDGFIVTNYHVVRGATSVSVTLNNKQVYDGKVVGYDQLADVAVVKISAGNNLPNLPWGDSNQLKPGERVLAFGNPFGLQFTVTSGIISGLGRPRLEAGEFKARAGYIQTDAAINEGNSGGPLCDVQGQVIGIDTAIFTPSGGFAGIGFALPSNVAKYSADQLIRYGKVTYGYLGVMIGNVDPKVAKALGTNSTNGAIVQQVDPGSPAAKAGLKTYDIITRLNGQTMQDSGQLQVAVGELPPGTTANLTVVRNGKPMDVSVKVGTLSMGEGSQMPAAEKSTSGVQLGVGITDLTSSLREQLQVPPDVQGVLVKSVVPGGPADSATPNPLVPGAIIEQVNRKPVTSTDELRNLLSGLPKGQDILVLAWFQGQSFVTVVHPVESMPPVGGPSQPSPDDDNGPPQQ
jgi:serine protease Do